MLDEVAHLPRFVREGELIDVEGEDLVGLDQLTLQGRIRLSNG